MYAASGGCDYCPAGMYNPTVGAAVCTPCPAGKYCAGTGLSAVSGECQAMSFSTDSAINSTCVPCAPGNISAVGSSACQLRMHPVIVLTMQGTVDTFFEGSGRHRSFVACLSALLAIPEEQIVLVSVRSGSDSIIVELAFLRNTTSSVSPLDASAQLKGAAATGKLETCGIIGITSLTIGGQHVSLTSSLSSDAGISPGSIAGIVVSIVAALIVHACVFFRAKRLNIADAKAWILASLVLGPLVWLLWRSKLKDPNQSGQIVLNEICFHTVPAPAPAYSGSPSCQLPDPQYYMDPNCYLPITASPNAASEAVIAEIDVHLELERFESMAVEAKIARSREDNLRLEEFRQAGLRNHNDPAAVSAELERRPQEACELKYLEQERLQREAAVAAAAEAQRRQEENRLKLEQERLQREAAVAAKLEQERLQREAAVAAKLEQERLQREAAVAAKLEQERLQREAAVAAKLEQERLQREAAVAAAAEAQRRQEEADKAELLVRMEVSRERELEQLLPQHMRHFYDDFVSEYEASSRSLVASSFQGRIIHVEMNPCLVSRGPAFVSFMRIRTVQHQVTSEYLWHGTALNNVPAICESGFDPSKRARQVHGPGEYFSTRWELSDAYAAEANGCKCQLLCLVIPGPHMNKPTSDIVVINNPESRYTRLLPTVVLCLIPPPPSPPFPDLYHMSYHCVSLRTHQFFVTCYLCTRRLSLMDAAP
jgi:hypothetical protein